MTTFDEPVEQRRLVGRRQPRPSRSGSWAAPQPPCPARGKASPSTRRPWRAAVVIVGSDPIARQLTGDAWVRVVAWVSTSTPDWSWPRAWRWRWSVRSAGPCSSAEQGYDRGLIGQGPDEFQAVLRCAGLAVAPLGCSRTSPTTRSAPLRSGRHPGASGALLGVVRTCAPSPASPPRARPGRPADSHGGPPVPRCARSSTALRSSRRTTVTRSSACVPR